jgi:hypothetical protein
MLHGRNLERFVILFNPALEGCAGQDVVIRNKIITDNEMPVYTVGGAFLCNAVGDYFTEGENLKEAINRVESAKKHTLASLAERGTNEVGIAAEQRIMIETALRAYDGSLPSVESLLGGPEEPEALSLAAGAEGTCSAKKGYMSELDARPEHILSMEVKHES